MNPDQRIGMDNCKEPGPDTVVGSVKDLADLLDSLGEGINRLEERIQPVLAESPAAVSATNPSEAPSDCETVRRLHQLQARTQVLRDHVRTITDLARV